MHLDPEIFLEGALRAFSSVAEKLPDAHGLVGITMEATDGEECESRTITFKLEATVEEWKALSKNNAPCNQGRIRSDSIASRMCDGLRFRSEPEIHLYRALKSLGVTFAPLAVFIQGGDTYRRIEPDFVIYKDGELMIVEVDGDTVHRETPVEAHSRPKTSVIY